MKKARILHTLRIIRGKKCTQEDVAKTLQCSTTDYALKEIGKKPITTEEWLKISKTLNMPIGLFFMNVPANVHDESVSLFYNFSRLSQKGQLTLKIILNNFLLSEQSRFEDKTKNKNKGGLHLIP